MKDKYFSNLQIIGSNDMIFESDGRKFRKKNHRAHSV